MFEDFKINDELIYRPSMEREGYMGSFTVEESILYHTYLDNISTPIKELTEQEYEQMKEDIEYLVRYIDNSYYNECGHRLRQHGCIFEDILEIAKRYNIEV